MEKSVVNQQSIESKLKKAGVICEFGNVGDSSIFSIFRRVISDPLYRRSFLKFHKNYYIPGLNYAMLIRWLKKNNLEKHLIGGSFKKQIRDWEDFYRNFYGSSFHIDRKKIFINTKRLPAIKAGLENGAVNSVQIEATPEALIEEKQEWTEAELFFYQVLKPTGIGIGRTKRNKRTKKTLNEILSGSGYIPVSPEDFNLIALRNNWSRECNRVAEKKGPVPKVVPGIVRLNFIDGRKNIPSDQKYVSQTGKVISIQNCSFTEAVEKDIRIMTPAQEILLAAKMFSDTGGLIVDKTWEFNSALLKSAKHEEKEKNSILVAIVASDCNDFYLFSDFADYSNSDFRFRLSL